MESIRKENIDWSRKNTKMETKTEYSSESQSERTEAIRKACNGFLQNESSKDISCRQTKNLLCTKEEE